MFVGVILRRYFLNVLTNNKYPLELSKLSKLKYFIKQDTNENFAFYKIRNYRPLSIEKRFIDYSKRLNSLMTKVEKYGSRILKQDIIIINEYRNDRIIAFFDFTLYHS